MKISASVEEEEGGEALARGIGRRSSIHSSVQLRIGVFSNGGERKAAKGRRISLLTLPRHPSERKRHLAAQHQKISTAQVTEKCFNTALCIKERLFC